MVECRGLGFSVWEFYFSWMFFVLVVFLPFFTMLVSWFVGVPFLVDYLPVSITPSSIFESLVHMWLVPACTLQSKRHFCSIFVTVLHRSNARTGSHISSQLCFYILLQLLMEVHVKKVTAEILSCENLVLIFPLEICLRVLADQSGNELCAVVLDSSCR